MSESYQATYDAVRSRIGSVNIGEVVERAVMQAFDFSQMVPALLQSAYGALGSMERPSVLYRPSLAADGTQWCALYGDNLMNGVAGFGDTPAEAMMDFDRAWLKERTPEAARREREKGA